MKNLKLYTAGLLMAFSLFSSAQEAVVSSLQKVELSEKAYHPVLTSQGKLLVTSEDYSGLKSYDLTTGTMKEMSAARKSGYNLLQSSDMRVRKMVLPDNQNYAVSENLKIAVFIDGKKRILTPNGKDRRYIWPSLSPDGKRIVYTVSGVGTYVCGVDGSNPVALGILRAPKWFGNDRVVGMVNNQTGGVIKSSIDMVNADGSGRQTLTPETVVGMYPSVSGNRIAFATDKGEVYLMEVAINE